MVRTFASQGTLLSVVLACSSPAPSEDASGGGGVPGGAGGSSPGGPGGDGGDGTGGNADGECSTSGLACQLTTCAVPLAGAQHTAPCAVLTYSSNPPTSGTHYEVWAAYDVYEEPVPRGFLVHSLEHSGVVLSYNCGLAEAAGLECDDLVSELTQFDGDWAADPLCSATRHRLIVTPDPLLDTVFAAAAWGFYIKGDCFDATQVGAFIDEHYGDTYENICNPGIDPASYPADCGQ